VSDPGFTARPLLHVSDSSKRVIKGLMQKCANFFLV